jgi:DNA-binding NarL/FixJ family response regulator
MPERGKEKATAVTVDPDRDWWDAVEQSLAGVDVTVVGRSESYDEGMRLIEQLRPDLVVVDPAQGERSVDGFTWIATVRDRFPAIKIIALSASTKTQEIELALARGASVYVVKRTPTHELAAAVRQLYSRSLYLAGTFDPPGPAQSAIESFGVTAREEEILTLTAEGLSNQAIARQLWVTEQTVKFHLSNIYRKLGVRNRTEASRWAHSRGLLGRHRRDSANA